MLFRNVYANFQSIFFPSLCCSLSFFIKFSASVARKAISSKFQIKERKQMFHLHRVVDVDDVLRLDLWTRSKQKLYDLDDEATSIPFTIFIGHRWFWTIALRITINSWSILLVMICTERLARKKHLHTHAANNWWKKMLVWLVGCYRCNVVPAKMYVLFMWITSFHFISIHCMWVCLIATAFTKFLHT